MKKIVVLLAVFLVACSTHTKKLTFAQQWSKYRWHLPAQQFNQHWDRQIDRVFAQAGCPHYLAQYIKESSDIISAAHTFPYDNFDLSNRCVRVLVSFTQFFLGHHEPLIRGQPNYTLKLRNNPRMSNESVAYLIELLHRDNTITKVDLRDNPLITHDALYALAHEGRVRVLSD